MTRRFASCLAIASLTFMSPRPAAAAITHVFDTVDAVEIGYQGGTIGQIVWVTGVRVGATSPATYMFTFANNTTGNDQALRCERLAVLAMSKPGKFRFGIASGTYYSSDGGCKLTLRTP